MPTLEQITILEGAMINLSNHEDDDAFIAEKPIIAIPVGGVINGGLPVRIPSLYPDRIYFIHKSEPKEA